MKEFFRKYKIIIFLVGLIVLMGFIKIYFGGSASKKTEEVVTVPTETPKPTNVGGTETTLEELKKMDDKTLINYLNQLSEEQVNNLPEEVPDDSLDYLLPYEEKDFRIEKYIAKRVLLVTAKTDMKTAQTSLKKWLDLHEDKQGENIIIWQEK